MTTTPKKDMIDAYCKKGDKVMVKNNLVVGEVYGESFFHAAMYEYVGKEITINDKGSENGSRTIYNIIEDGCAHIWSDAMFDY